MFAGRSRPKSILTLLDRGWNGCLQHSHWCYYPQKFPRAAQIPFEGAKEHLLSSIFLPPFFYLHLRCGFAVLDFSLCNLGGSIRKPRRGGIFVGWLVSGHCPLLAQELHHVANQLGLLFLRNFLFRVRRIFGPAPFEAHRPAVADELQP